MQSKQIFSSILGISLLLAPMQAAADNILVPLITGGISGHMYAKFFNKDEYLKLSIIWVIMSSIKKGIFGKAADMDNLDSLITLAAFLGETYFDDDIEQALAQMSADDKGITIRGAKEVKITREEDKVVVVDERNNRYTI